MKLQPRTIRLPQELWDQVEDVALSERRTVNNMVQVLLEESLEEDLIPVRDGHPVPPYGQGSDNFTGASI